MSKTLLKASPLGKAPVLEHNGETLTESAAIIYQLISENSPPPHIERTVSRNSMFWSHFSEGSLMMYIQPRVVVNAVSSGAIARDKGGDSQGVKKLQSMMNRWADGNCAAALGQMDEFLAKHQNFTGTDQIGLGDVSCQIVL